MTGKSPLDAYEFKLTVLRITKLDVTQEGSVRIAPIRNFKDAGLHPAMLKNVQLAGYDVPTPIQQYCLPAVFKGHDVVACAQTGKLISIALHVLLLKFHC